MKEVKHTTIENEESVPETPVEIEESTPEVETAPVVEEQPPVVEEQPPAPAEEPDENATPQPMETSPGDAKVVRKKNRGTGSQITDMISRYNKQFPDRTPHENTLAFMAILRFAMKNPIDSVLDPVFKMFLSSEKIIAMRRIHVAAYENKNYSMKTAKQISYTYTVFDRAAAAVRAQRPFRLDPKAIRVGLNNGPLTDYIMARVSKLI
jgi:hypothetical protein